MTQVWERLYIGGAGDAEALAESNPFGITAVRAKADDVNYLRFPVSDSRPIPVAQFDGIVDAQWENIRWGTVLLVSQSGTSRAPITAAAWMQVVGCKSIDAALGEIGTLRTVEPHPILLRSVKRALK